MDYKGRVFRLFVSSTFVDFQHERDALRRSVFPEVRRYCQARGASFQPIDLRWGVSPDAAIDQRTLRICLEEVERCRQVSPQLNFLALLGDRYGSRLLPGKIPADEFLRFVKHMSQEARTLFHQWYRDDHNAVPISFVLKQRIGRFKETHIWSEEVQKPLCAELGKAAIAAGLPLARRLKYVGSATHQEIYAGVLRQPPAAGALCFMRETSGAAPASGAPDNGSTGDSSAQELLKSLKENLSQALSDDAVQTYSLHWKQRAPVQRDLEHFCQVVKAALLKQIDATLQASDEASLLTLEVQAQQDFAADRRSGFRGRQDVWDRIDRYVRGTNEHEAPLVIFGPGGSGKSAMLAYAAARTKAEMRDALVSDLYLGATPRSGTIRDVLETLSLQLRRSVGGDETTIGADLYKLALDFKTLLQAAGRERRIVLFIDALDQARDHVQSLTWLSTVLPTNVRIIVSTLPGPQLDALTSRIPHGNQIEMPRLGSSDARQVMAAWLADQQRTLQPEQEDALMRAFEVTGSPLYLRMASMEASHWPSYESAPTLNPTLTGLVADLFHRLSAPAEHGAALVSHSLGYLAAAFEGLAEEELLDVLSQDDEVLREVNERAAPGLPKQTTETGIPPVLWARLYSDLDPYLSPRYLNGMRLLGFYHRVLENAARQAYLAAPLAPARHGALATYFDAQPANIGAPGERRANARRLDVLPYHLTEAGSWSRLSAVLSDIDFLLDKVRTGRSQRRSTFGVATDVYTGVGALRDDFARALQRLEGPAQGAWLIPHHEIEVLEGLERAIRLEGAILSTYPDNLWPILYNRLQWGAEAVRAWLSRAHSRRDVRETKPWLRLKSPTHESQALIATMRHIGTMDSCIVDKTGNLIIAGSSALRDRSLTVWDRRTSQLQAILHDHTFGTSLRGMTADNQRALVIRGDPASLVNITSGEWTDLSKKDTNDSWGAAISPNGAFAVFARRAKDVTMVYLDGSQRAIRLMEPDAPFTYHTLDSDLDYDCCAVSPSSNLVLVGMNFGEYALIDVSGQSPRPVWKNSTRFDAEHIVDAAFAPDESYIVLAADEGRLIWVDTEHGHEIHAKHAHEGRTLACSISANGQYVASGGTDARVVLWDAQTGEQVRELVGHTNEVNSCAFTPDSRFLVTAGDTSLRVWDLTIPEQPRAGGEVQQWRNIRQFINGGRSVIAVDHDNSVYEYETATGNRGVHLYYDPSMIELAVSSDSTYALGVQTTEPNFRHIKVWELKTGLSGKYVTSGIQPGPVRVSPSGAFALIVQVPDHEDDDPVTGLYDARTWTLRVPLQRESLSRFTAFTPDSAYLITTDHEHDLRILRTEDGANVTPSHTPDPTARTIQFCLASPDGKHYATVGLEQEVRIWDAGTLRSTPVCVPPHGGVSMGLGGIAFSPDGGLLAHETADGYAALWDSQARAVIRLGDSPIGHLISASFSPDGAYLLTTDFDLVRLWHVARRQQILAQPLPGTPSTVAFHPWQPLALCNDTNNGYLTDLVGITFGPLIVTASQQAGTLSARCPKCQSRITFQRGQVGRTVTCPTKDCKALLAVNSFVVTPHIPTWARDYAGYAHVYQTGSIPDDHARKPGLARQILGRLAPFARRSRD